MKPGRYIFFPPYRLDLANQVLTQAGQVISLRPKTFAVLEYLAARPHQLVSKNELLDAIWPNTAVSDTVLKVCIREIRKAFDDRQESPRIIQTAHRRGYKFIAEMVSEEPVLGRLPKSLTSFIGREREIQEIKQLLKASTLLTVLGPGGAGKTRLAIEAARQLPDRVCWIELASLKDPGLTIETVAAAIGVREEGALPLKDVLIGTLKEQELVLLLDNCEHVATQCADMLKELLSACNRIRVLATSRQALGVAGEITWSIPTLPIPDIGTLPSLGQLKNYDAVRLFIDRARSVLPTIDLSDTDLRDAAEISARLDGLPLAIELAAARVRVLGVNQIARRLDKCFSLLGDSGQAAMPGHGTLWATIDWSYQLLDPNEKLLLARLSIFAGEFSLEAAESICGGGELETGRVLGLLAQLVEKSLVDVRAGKMSATPRYRLLEVVRQYAREKLTPHETSQIGREHSRFFMEFAEDVAQRINSSERSRWLSSLEDEHDNIRTALKWAIQTANSEMALRFGAALLWFWVPPRLLGRRSAMDWSGSRFGSH